MVSCTVDFRCTPSWEPNSQSNRLKALPGGISLQEALKGDILKGGHLKMGFCTGGVRT